MTNRSLRLGPNPPGTALFRASQLIDEAPVAESLSTERGLLETVRTAERLNIREKGVGEHASHDMRAATRTSRTNAGNYPILRGATRICDKLGMAEAPKIDLAKLRALVIANSGPGKKMTRRALSLKASEGKNPDLIRDLMRVDKRKPTFETAAGICAALDVDVSEVVKGSIVGGAQASEWIEVAGSVAAGVWREHPEWPEEDRYEVQVGVATGEGDRFGLSVEGRSMDRTLPPGTILECAALIGSGLSPESGDYVIAERVRAGLYERTVKRLLILDDGSYELVAESTLPEFQMPIVIGKPDPETFGDAETRIIALVLRAHLVLHRSKKRAT